MKNDIKLHGVIINGEPTEGGIRHYTDRGWILTGYQPANKFHPYACDTDYIMFFAKPIDKEAYDQEMKEFYESQGNTCDEQQPE